jgi:hypothetical protein
MRTFPRLSPHRPHRDDLASATIVTADLTASSGVIHAIDAVLVASK